MTRDELLTLTQRLREYNHNPHHINPVSDAFHKLIVDAANALSAVAAVWGCLAIPDGWRIERRELDGSVCFIIGAPRMAGVRSNTSVWLSDSDPAHLLLWHLLAAAPAQPAAQEQFNRAHIMDALLMWNRRHEEPPIKVGYEYGVAGVVLDLAAAHDQGERYTCIGKGGNYELVGYARLAGELRDMLGGLVPDLAIYRSDTDYFARTRKDFKERMEPIDAASTGQEV